MSRYKRILEKIKPNYALLALIAYLGKTLLISANYSDSIIISALCGLYGFSLYLKSREPKVSIDQETRRELAIMKDTLSKLNLGSGMSSGKKKGFRF